MEILLKIKPNEKYENLKFYENLKIWLEILLKTKPNEKYENLKFCSKLLCVKTQSQLPIKFFKPIRVLVTIN